MWEGVSHSGKVCPSVGVCAPVWGVFSYVEGVPQCGSVCPSVEGVPQCGRVCPSVGGCPPLWEGVSLYVCM